jgi:hypothetical protein
MSKIELKGIEFQIVEQPDRRRHPFCDFNPQHRALSNFVRQLHQEHPSHPESTSVAEYKKTLMAAGVRPIDILNCVDAFKKRIEAGSKPQRPQPIEVELFIDRGK